MDYFVISVEKNSIFRYNLYSYYFERRDTMDNFNIIPNIHSALYRKTYDGWRILKRTILDHELVLIVGGKGVVGIEDKEYDVKKGMLFYFNPGIEHFLETQKEDPMHFYGVHFDFAHLIINNSSCWNVMKGERLRIEAVSQTNNGYILVDIFKKLNMYWKNKFPGYELICRALLQQLIFEVLEDNRAKSFNYVTYTRVEKIVDYIQQNFQKKITLEELAEISELTPTYLSKVFRKITGYTVVGFINRLKVDKAKELIIEGNNKIKEIAHLSGFEDEFYFSRVFKKLEGVSPSTYYIKYIDE